MSRRAPLAALAVVALLLAAGMAWQMPGEPPPAAVGPGRAPSATAVPTQGLHPTPAAPAAAAAPMLALGTEADTLFTPDLLHRLEALLLEAGAADSPEALKQRVRALAAQRFTPELAQRAAALAARYVDYRVALGQLKRPASQDAGALRHAMHERQQLRARFFAPEEDAALFAQQDALDRFAVARVALLQDTQLAPAQREAALRQAEQELSEPLRTARAEMVQHAAVAAQTGAFDARSAGEQERYAQRRAQYGEAAALRLQQLDAQERDWQARLDTYAAAQAAQSGAAELAELEQRLFAPQERMRLPAALQLRAAKLAQAR